MLISEILSAATKQPETRTILLLPLLNAASSQASLPHRSRCTFELPLAVACVIQLPEFRIKNHASRILAETLCSTKLTLEASAAAMLDSKGRPRYNLFSRLICASSLHLQLVGQERLPPAATQYNPHYVLKALNLEKPISQAGHSGFASTVRALLTASWCWR